jgi:hypothetical protein
MANACKNARFVKMETVRPPMKQLMVKVAVIVVAMEEVACPILVA